MNELKGRHFRGELVLWAVRWYGSEPGVKAYSHVSDRFSPLSCQRHWRRIPPPTGTDPLYVRPE